MGAGRLWWSSELLVITACLSCVSRAEVVGLAHASPGSPMFIAESIEGNLTTVRNELLRRGWRENTRRFGVGGAFDFKWTWDWSRAARTYESQIVNQFPYISNLTEKDWLFRNLRRLNKTDTSLGMNEFVPETFLISSPAGRKSFVAAFREAEARDPTALWIVKAGRLARGSGIKVFSRLQTVKSFVNKHRHWRPFLVQRYIKDPLLVRGRKFDIRVFAVLLSVNPPVIYLNQNSYMRFASRNYTLAPAQFETDRLSPWEHLTNHQIQMHSQEEHPDFPGYQWPLSKMRDYLEEVFGEENVWERKVQPQLRRITAAIARAAPRGMHQNGCFQLIGLDVVLDRNLRAWLLEVNKNPGLHMLTDVVREHTPAAVRDAIKMVVDYRDIPPAARPATIGSFERVLPTAS